MDLLGVALKRQWSQRSLGGRIQVGLGEITKGLKGHPRPGTVLKEGRFGGGGAQPPSRLQEEHPELLHPRSPVNVS